MAKANPGQFMREVRQEVSKVPWTSRKETLISTGMVLMMVFMAALFFFLQFLALRLFLRSQPLAGSAFDLLQSAVGTERAGDRPLRRSSFGRLPLRCRGARIEACGSKRRKARHRLTGLR